MMKFIEFEPLSNQLHCAPPPPPPPYTLHLQDTPQTNHFQGYRHSYSINGNLHGHFEHVWTRQDAENGRPVTLPLAASTNQTSKLHTSEFFMKTISIFLSQSYFKQGRQRSNTCCIPVTWCGNQLYNACCGQNTTSVYIHLPQSSRTLHRARLFTDLYTYAGRVAGDNLSLFTRILRMSSRSHRLQSGVHCIVSLTCS